MKLFAPAKLNLFLEVCGKRPDGYHAIETVMVPLDFGDEVSVEAGATLDVKADRADVPDGEGNLAFRIVRAAERMLGRDLPARIRIRKRVPPGSGLGAGSSDAVAALEGVLHLHGVEIDTDGMERIAASVGSDTAFFVRGAPALCTGRGEITRPVACAGERWVVLVTGALPAPTAEVYACVRTGAARRSPEALLRALAASGDLPDELLFNRLREAAFQRFPALAALHADLESLAQGPVHLSGSGSAFFRLVPDPKTGSHLAALLEEDTGLSAILARFGEQCPGPTGA